MTKAHAAYQLLRHGALDLGQFQEITGWKYHTCTRTLSRLEQSGTVRRTKRGGSAAQRSCYEVQA
jgi:DNA-binding MarR family transcriptional regulator